MAKKDDRVKVRIKPLHGIGGVGEAGDEVLMSKDEAEQYFMDGYVEYVEAKSEPSVVISTAAEPDPRPEPIKPDTGAGTVMKPETKRTRARGAGKKK
jgi:hypothetical protein